MERYEAVTHERFFPKTQARWEDISFSVSVGTDTYTDRQIQMPGMPALGSVIVGALEYILDREDRGAKAAHFLKRVIETGEKTRISILAAHGETERDQWFYYESGYRVGTVKSWIDTESAKLGEKPSVLIVSTCNPHNKRVCTSGIPVLYPTGNIGFLQDYRNHLLS